MTCNPVLRGDYVKQVEVKPKGRGCDMSDEAAQVKIIQFQAMPNDATWQGCVLGLGDDGVMYVSGVLPASGKWRVYQQLTFEAQH